MKRIIATVLTAIVGLFGYTIVDTAIEARVSSLESRVASLESRIDECHCGAGVIETTTAEAATTENTLLPTVRPEKTTVSVTTEKTTGSNGSSYYADAMKCKKCGLWFPLQWWNPHWEKCYKNTCVKCGTNSESEEEFSAHLKNCTVDDAEFYIRYSAEELLTVYLAIAKTELPQWDYIECEICRVIDYISDPEVSESEVMSVVESLESFDVPGAEPVLEALKIKINNMYAKEETATVAKTEAVTSV